MDSIILYFIRELIYKQSHLSVINVFVQKCKLKIKLVYLSRKVTKLIDILCKVMNNNMIIRYGRALPELFGEDNPYYDANNYDENGYPIGYHVTNPNDVFSNLEDTIDINNDGIINSEDASFFLIPTHTNIWTGLGDEWDTTNVNGDFDIDGNHIYDENDMLFTFSELPFYYDPRHLRGTIKYHEDLKNMVIDIYEYDCGIDAICPGDYCLTGDCNKNSIAGTDYVDMDLNGEYDNIPDSGWYRPDVSEGDGIPDTGDSVRLQNNGIDDNDDGVIDDEFEGFDDLDIPFVGAFSNLRADILPV